MKQIFESDYISYVEVTQDLIQDYLVMVNDHENVNRFLGSWKREAYTEEDEIAWVEKKLEEKAVVFSMIEKKTGEFIGNIELIDIHEMEAELGIAVTAGKQDMGYGSEAVTAMTRYGFDRLGLHRIVLRAKPCNPRAIHVYEKCGFKEYDRNDEHVYMELSKQRARRAQLEVISFYDSDRQEHWLEEIKRSDWAGGVSLYKRILDNTLMDKIGEGEVLLLVDGDELISFCTYARLDNIQPTDLTPWMGYVYTFPEHRGHHYLGYLFEEVEHLARQDNVPQIYISTDHTGLYEKYGCEYLTEMEDVHGEPSRIYVKRFK